MVLGLVWVVTGLVVVWIGVLGRRRKLPRQHWAGIRLPSTMRSDAAWAAAHEVAGPFLLVAGGGSLLSGVLLLVWQPGPGAQEQVSLTAAGWLVAWVLAASVVAVRAARGTTDR